MTGSPVSRRHLAALAAGSATAAAFVASSASPAVAQTAPPLPWFDIRADWGGPGAVGNGTADDTAAIQRAVNAAAAAANGGVVLAPPGVFKITGPVQFPAGKAIDLVGAGKWQTEFRCAAATAGLRFGGPGPADGASAGSTGGFRINGQNQAMTAMSVARCSNRTFFDIQINNATAVGLRIDGLQNSLVEEVLVNGCQTGLVLDHGAGGNVFSSVQLRNSRTNLLFQNTWDGVGSDRYLGRPTDNKFFGGIIEGGPDEMTEVQVDHAAGVDNYFVGVRFGGNGPKIRVRHQEAGGDGRRSSQDLNLVSCYFVGNRDSNGVITGSGIEHVATNTQIKLVNCKFQTLTPAFTLGNSCLVEIDAYRDVNVPTRFANAAGGTHTEDFLIRREAFHQHNITTLANTNTALATWVGTGITVNRSPHPHYRLKTSGDVEWGPGSTAADIRLRRSAAGQLRVERPSGVANQPILLVNGGLGVGNAADAAGPVGQVVKKIQVFDANGNPLGYIPVYSSIT